MNRFGASNSLGIIRGDAVLLLGTASEPVAWGEVSRQQTSSLRPAVTSGPGRRPAPEDGLQGPPVLSAFFGFNMGTRLEAAIAEFAPEVQSELRRRLRQRASYQPLLKVRKRGNAIADEIREKRLKLEGAIVPLIGRPGANTAASRYAAEAVLSYEWEGDPGGPLAEAAFAAKFLSREPRSVLRPFIYVNLLYLYRCAFETASWNSTPDLKAEMASSYVDIWNRLQRWPDPVIRAVAEDIDAEQLLYIGGQGHPRTFKN